MRESKAPVNLVMVVSNLKALPKEFLSVDILCSGKVLACAPLLYPGFSIGGGPNVIMTSQRDQGHGRSGRPRRHEAETATSTSPTLVEVLRGLSVPDAGH